MTVSLRAKAKATRLEGKARPFKPFLGVWTSFGYYLTPGQKWFMTALLFVVAYAVMVLFDTMLGALGILSGAWFVWNGRDGSFTEHEKKWFVTIAGASFYFIVTKLWGAYLWLLLYALLLLLVWRGDTLRGFRAGGIRGAIARVVRGGFRSVVPEDRKRAARFMARTMLFQTVVLCALVAVGGLQTAAAREVCGDFTTDCDPDPPASLPCGVCDAIKSLVVDEPVEAVQGDLAPDGISLTNGVPAGSWLPAVRDAETGSTTLSIPVATQSNRCEASGGCLFDVAPSSSSWGFGGSSGGSSRSDRVLTRGDLGEGGPAAPGGGTSPLLYMQDLIDAYTGILWAPHTPYSAITFDGIQEQYHEGLRRLTREAARASTSEPSLPPPPPSTPPEVSIDLLEVGPRGLEVRASATDEDGDLRTMSVFVDYRTRTGWVKLDDYTRIDHGDTAELSYRQGISQVGQYRVIVVAKDSMENLASEVDQVSVLSVAPNIEFVQSGVDSTVGVAGVTDFTFTVAARVTNGVEGDIVYVFDYGDDAETTYKAVGKSNEPVTATFRYGAADHTAQYAPLVTATIGDAVIERAFPPVTVTGNTNGTGPAGDMGVTVEAIVHENKAWLWAGGGLLGLAGLLLVLHFGGAFRPGASGDRFLERAANVAKGLKTKLKEEKAMPTSTKVQPTPALPAYDLDDATSAFEARAARRARRRRGQQ